MSTIHAIFENGVFRPLNEVDLPDHSEVEFEPRFVANPTTENAGMVEIYKILSERFHSGEHDVAARHNEHQP